MKDFFFLIHCYDTHEYNVYGLQTEKKVQKNEFVTWPVAYVSG